MVWNYRVVKYVDGRFGLHEVYYDDDGLPTCSTVEPMLTVDPDEGVPAIIHEPETAPGDARNRTVLDDWVERPRGQAQGPLSASAEARQTLGKSCWTSETRGKRHQGSTRPAALLAVSSCSLLTSLHLRPGARPPTSDGGCRPCSRSAAAAPNSAGGRSTATRAREVAASCLN